MYQTHALDTILLSSMYFAKFILCARARHVVLMSACPCSSNIKI